MNWMLRMNKWEQSIWIWMLTLITTTEQPQTLRGLPSLSILHKPLHSPNFLFESTRINGIWCSLHKAVINFLYCGSSQLSAKIAKTAWRLLSKCYLLVAMKQVRFRIHQCCYLHVECFACLMNATYQTIGNKGFFQNFLQCCVDVHWTANNGWYDWSFAVTTFKYKHIVIIVIQKSHNTKHIFVIIFPKLDVPTIHILEQFIPWGNQTKVFVGSCIP